MTQCVISARCPIDTESRISCCPKELLTLSYVIRRVAVIGSGTMGGALAGLFANTGLSVSLLDIVPNKLSPDEEKKKLTLESPAVRNRIVNAGMQGVVKSK